MTTHDAKDAITHIERTTTTATKNNKDVDTAARWLADVHVGDAAFTHEEEQAVLRRIDFRVLPLLLGAYFFQQVRASHIYLSSNMLMFSSLISLPYHTSPSLALRKMQALLASSIPG
jgi:hypothetical protein